MKRLETERLILRVPRLEDFDELYAIHANPETNRFNLGWEKQGRKNLSIL